MHSADSGPKPSAPDPSDPQIAESVLLINVDRIQPTPHQPRQRVGELELQQLAASIASVGVIEPIVVREIPGGYELIAGERRWRAVQKLGWRRVPALVRNLAEREAALRTLIENLQREDLSPLEEARAYRSLIEEMGLSQEEVADRAGKDRSTVANALRLLRLPADVQELLSRGSLTSGHARAVLSLDGAEPQTDLAHRIVDEGLTVRQAEAAAAAVRGRPPTERKIRARENGEVPALRTPEHEAMEHDIRRALGTKVRIHPRTAESGMVEVEYYKGSDLDRIFRRLAGQ